VGPNYAGTSAGASTGLQAWANPSFAAGAPNRSAAQCYVGTPFGQWSEFLLTTNYGFSVPGNAVIDGVVARVHRWNDSVQIKDNLVALVIAGNVAFGDTKGTANNWSYQADQGFAGNLDAQVYGGATDKWNLALTPAIVNASDFGVGWSLYSADNSFHAGNIDASELTVYYSFPVVVPDSARVRTQAVQRSVTW
jgi:hypothetical protein